MRGAVRLWCGVLLCVLTLLIVVPRKSLISQPTQIDVDAMWLTTIEPTLKQSLRDYNGRAPFPFSGTSFVVEEDRYYSRYPHMLMDAKWREYIHDTYLQAIASSAPYADPRQPSMSDASLCRPLWMDDVPAAPFDPAQPSEWERHRRELGMPHRPPLSAYVFAILSDPPYIHRTVAMLRTTLRNAFHVFVYFTANGNRSKKWNDAVRIVESERPGDITVVALEPDFGGNETIFWKNNVNAAWKTLPVVQHLTRRNVLEFLDRKAERGLTEECIATRSCHFPLWMVLSDDDTYYVGSNVEHMQYRKTIQLYDEYLAFALARRKGLHIPMTHAWGVGKAIRYCPNCRRRKKFMFLYGGAGNFFSRRALINIAPHVTFCTRQFTTIAGDERLGACIDKFDLFTVTDDCPVGDRRYVIDCHNDHPSFNIGLVANGIFRFITPFEPLWEEGKKISLPQLPHSFHRLKRAGDFDDLHEVETFTAHGEASGGTPRSPFRAVRLREAVVWWHTHRIPREAGELVHWDAFLFVLLGVHGSVYNHPVLLYTMLYHPYLRWKKKVTNPPRGKLRPLGNSGMPTNPTRRRPTRP